MEGSPSGHNVGSECYRGDVYIELSPLDTWRALGSPRLPTRQEETPDSRQLLRARHRHYRMEKVQQWLMKKTKKPTWTQAEEQKERNKEIRLYS